MQLLKLISVIFLLFAFSGFNISERFLFFGGTRFDKQLPRPDFDTTIVIPGSDDTLCISVYAPSKSVYLSKSPEAVYLISDSPSDELVQGCREYLFADEKWKKNAVLILINEKRGPEQDSWYDSSAYFESFSSLLGNHIRKITGTQMKPFSEKANRTLIADGKSTSAAMYTLFRFPKLFNQAGVYCSGEPIGEPVSELVSSGCNGYNGKLFFYESSETADSSSQQLLDQIGEDCQSVIFRMKETATDENKKGKSGSLKDFFSWIGWGSKERYIKLD